jgi:protein associated with RNAse G/E
MQFKPGDTIHVRTLHADGQPYRSWQAVVEHATHDCLVTLSLLGSLVHDARGDRITKSRMRDHYWSDRLYNLIEVFSEDGTIQELYANVATPPVMTEHGFDVTDHELDVSWLPGQPARIVDEDEFTAAAGIYGYSLEFQVACRAAAIEALRLVETWQPGVIPPTWPTLPGA